MAVIEVFADIWCPFTHVGLRAMTRRREQLGRGDLAIWVRAWPLELVNGRPLDPNVAAKQIAALEEQVDASLFVGFDPDHFPTTMLPALALAAAAYRDDMAIGEAVSLALRDALFEEGRDIARPDVLREVAGRHGVTDLPSDDGEVIADWREGQARGVKGSPHFYCGALEAYCPALNISRDPDGHLHVQRDLETMERFLAECLTQ
jgi:predicted DsbA family dithiol-disulfide isomerase